MGRSYHSIPWVPTDSALELAVQFEAGVSPLSSTLASLCASHKTRRLWSGRLIKGFLSSSGLGVILRPEGQ